MNLIYTVNFNDYDSLKPISYQSSKTDCICVTDRINLKNKTSYRGWRIFYVNLEYNPINVDRFYKFEPWILGDYEESIYIDSNIHLKENPFSLIRSDIDLALFHHQNRRTVQAELDHLRHIEEYGKRDFKIKNWPKEILETCLKENNLFWGGIIYRRHSNKIITAMIHWKTIYCSGILRDQISLPYVISEHNLSLQILTGQNSILDRFPHIQKGSIYSMILSFCSTSNLAMLIFTRFVLPIRRIIKKFIS